LFALIDDIASVLDDVALMTKVASKQTAGVLGDDLALNAQQVSGVHADRELPVVWAVAKGSARNKAILVPVALAVSGLAPWGVMPLLMLGGAYLCFEACEKLAHKLLHTEPEADANGRAELVEQLADPRVDPIALEQDKIKGAIRTDFVLSAEIVTIALGAVAGAPFSTQVLALIALSALMTAGVYGFVAAIVKLDDLGSFLYRRGALHAGRSLGHLEHALGRGILLTAPALMKLLSVAGTIAMFLVGGGIIVHGVPLFHGWSDALSEHAAEIAVIGPALAWCLPPLLNGLIGLALGAIAVALHALFTRSSKRAQAEKP
jgi:predicted DNA repair protein MutK